MRLLFVDYAWLKLCFLAKYHVFTFGAKTNNLLKIGVIVQTKFVKNWLHLKGCFHYPDFVIQRGLRQSK